MTEVITKKIGACGGIGGGVRDMNINGVTRIVKISIRHGHAIDAITVDFFRNGREESTERWGGPRGGLTEFHLYSSEYITCVKGHFGAFERMIVLRSLKFETNLRSFGPYGREEGCPFELSAARGQIIGFHARSGTLLDALGVYVQDTEGNVRKELEDCKQKLKHKEAEYLNQLRTLRAELESKDNLQKMLESKIEHQTGLVKKLSAELNSKEDLQKKLESKIECLENKNKLLQTELKHTQAEYLQQLKGLRAESDSKDESQKKLESKIEYLENENDSVHTKLKHTEVEHLMHSQELRAELGSKYYLQKKLESKIEYLGNENELLQTKFKEYRGRAFDALVRIEDRITFQS